jgi:hypothetical protein
MALTQKQLDTIRNDIYKQVINAVNNKKNILLKHPPGVGKTATTLLAALQLKDKTFIYSSPNHQHLVSLENKEFLRKIGYHEILHMKGLFYEDENEGQLCSNPKVKVLLDCNFSKAEICDSEECDYYYDCPYLDQFRNLGKQSWRGVHSHISTSFLTVFKRDCVIIDENSVSALVSTLEITENDLIENKRFVEELYESLSEHDKMKLSKVVNLIFKIIDVLIDIQRESEKRTKESKHFEGIVNMDFVRLFVFYLGWTDSAISEKSDLIQGEVMDEFNEVMTPCITVC